MKLYLKKPTRVFCALSILVFSTLSTGVSAVELAADGLGDVLIMPYYTVRDVQDRDGLDAGKYESRVNIMNTSADTVAIQVKVLEAQHGRLCGKINVVLSPHDAWTAAIQSTASGVRFLSVDNSCTSPQMTAAGGTAKELAFTNNDFATHIFRQDDGPSSIDRCKEGFIEVFALGRSVASNSATNGTIANNAKHTDDQPKNCGPVREAFEVVSKFGAMKTEFKEPTNSLKGTYTLLNITNGIAYGGEFVALANFYSPDLTNGGGKDGTSDNDLLPVPLVGGVTLNSANPKESVVPTTGSGGLFRTLTDTWNRGVDAVSAVLARSHAMNQWTTNIFQGAETAWVVTMPTFEHYTNSTSIPPFQDSFAANTDILDPLGLPSGGACSRVGIQLYDRDENKLSTRFTPQNSGSAPLLCYAANPITFNGGNLMGSTLARNINADDAKNGWMKLNLSAGSGRFSGGLGRNDSGAGSNASDDIYSGLPAIAVSFTIRAKGSAGTNFGTLWQHSYQRSIGEPLIFIPRF